MIDVLLALHNGAAYLPELLDSLRDQTCRDFRLLALDDGSTDGSADILRRRAGDFPGLILLPGPASGSACGSFFRLLAASSAPYVMFCDQDDVWDKEKIAVTLDAMRRAEAQYGAETPVLVHTDLRVTDAALHVTAPSMMALQRLHPERQDLPRLLCQSLVTGCTVMANAPLRSLVPPEPPEHCLMHDWFLSLLAAACGQIVYLDRTTVSYRQHGGNAVGAKDSSSPAYLLSRLRSGSANRAALYATCAQAGDLPAVLRGHLSPERAELLRAYAELPELPPRERRRRLLFLGTLKADPLRRLGQFLYI